MQTTQPRIDPDAALALEEQVCFALSVAARNVVAVYKPILEPLGLTHPQYLVMLAMWQHEPVSVRELSTLLHLDPATLSPLLKRLEASGLLRRERNAEDERALAVTLTERGRDLRSEALTVPPAVMSRLDMGLEELVALRESLHQVITATRTALAEPVAGRAEPVAVRA
ncbi:MarR family transcriptional regulator [Ornithinimicrobium ciconiae]|uniref:MarR family transcriptional regulator n=2 Tax=Ornithinimicrobium ciconiae TaxID=2594265 RepID=A0A516GFM8_9MICO|nr:MarR family transcriptional regulator [Ornithinimicrobium ciconiae]